MVDQFTEKRGPESLVPPLSSLGLKFWRTVGEGAGSSSAGTSSLLSARLRERPILRSATSTRRTTTSISSSTLTTSSGFSTLWLANSEMWRRPSRSSSRETKTPKLVIFVTLPTTRSPVWYLEGIRETYGSSVICLRPSAMRRFFLSTLVTTHSISSFLRTTSLG